MTAIEQLVGLPADIDELAATAGSEGLALMTRLVEDYRSGKNRFDQLGEGLWATRDAGILIGVCGLNQHPFADPEDNAGRVRRLYVLPEWRRKGVASALADAVEHQARDHFDALTAFTTDARARAFYEARGFETVVGVPKRSFQLRLTDGLAAGV